MRISVYWRCQDLAGGVYRRRMLSVSHGAQNVAGCSYPSIDCAGLTQVTMAVWSSGTGLHCLPSLFVVCDGAFYGELKSRLSEGELAHHIRLALLLEPDELP